MVSYPMVRPFVKSSNRNADLVTALFIILHAGLNRLKCLDSKFNLKGLVDAALASALGAWFPGSAANSPDATAVTARRRSA